MALIKSVRGFTPKIGKDCFIAENATLVGDVTMGDECSIWFSTVLRGDVNTITIGDRVNIQDGSVLHTLYQKSVIEIGNDVSVGHNVTIHGAKVCDYALIGMGSVLLDGVEVGEGASWQPAALFRQALKSERTNCGWECPPSSRRWSIRHRQRR